MWRFLCILALSSDAPSDFVDFRAMLKLTPVAFRVRTGLILGRRKISLEYDDDRRLGYDPGRR